MASSEHGADVRQEERERWERVAPRWGRRAERIRDLGMPVSLWLIENLRLQPGQRLLELAAGPGDTGFLAAELIQPGGVLICSDAAEAMLDVARARAEELRVDKVEFRRLELEWIDLDTASVDAVLCRWGIMLIPDPGASLQEMRRVLRAGGRAAVAVWDDPEANPWATIPGRSLVELGHAEPPDRNAPGMFALAAPGRLEEALSDAGFTDVTVEAVSIERRYADVHEYLEETLDLSMAFSEPWNALSPPDRDELVERIRARAEPYTESDGGLRLPGRSLVAAGNA